MDQSAFEMSLMDWMFTAAAFLFAAAAFVAVWRDYK